MADVETSITLSFETLPQARAKTEAAATFLEQKLQTYVDVLRSLMAPRFSGVPAFIELIDLDSSRTFDDPLKSKFESLA